MNYVSFDGEPTWGGAYEEGQFPDREYEGDFIVPGFLPPISHMRYLISKWFLTIYVIVGSVILLNLLIGNVLAAIRYVIILVYF